MRILLINVPHPSIGSRIPDNHLPPLGLLSIGGPLLDADLKAGREPLFSIWGRNRFGASRDPDRRAALGYKHQVLSTRHLPPWRVLLWVKAIEAIVQLRPKALWRTILQPDPRLRHAMRWYAEMGRRVWLYELRNFFFRDRRMSRGPSVREFWGAPQDHEERSMTVREPRRELVGTRST